MKLRQLSVLLFALGGGIAAAQVRPCVQIQCPDNLFAESSSAAGAVVRFTPVVQNACGSALNTNCTPPSGSVFPPGTTIVSCTAADLSRNVDRCTFAITVRDTRPPAIVATGGFNADCTGPNGAPVQYSVAARDLVDPLPDLSCTPPPGSMFPPGTNTVVCTAVDAAGNRSTASFPVVVSGACAGCLELVCPGGPFDAVAGEDGVAPISFVVTATNHCAGEAWVRCVPPSGFGFPMGDTTVICSAGVGANPTTLKRCEFQVRVKDTVPPSIRMLRTSMTVVCQGFSPAAQPGAYVSFNGVIVDDNVDPAPVVTFNPPAGSFFTLGTHTIGVTAVDASGNEASRRFRLEVVSGPACELNANVLDLADNWDFELGLKGWTRTGTAFGSQPTVGDNVQVRRIPDLTQQISENVGGDYWQELAYPIGHHGTNWIGTAENHGDDTTPLGTMQGDGPTGTLMSKPFALQQRYVTFLIGGGNDPSHLQVELMIKTEPGTPGAVQSMQGWFKSVMSATGHGAERLRRETFDTVSYQGQLARIRIVDGSTSGHLNVDDFRFQPRPPWETDVKIGGITRRSVVEFAGRYYDWDSPVWGLADLHTHPMSHLGLGRRVFHGQPDGVVPVALGNCNCNHGGSGADNGCGNYLRQLVVSAFDGENPADPHREGWHDTNPWARFSRWPVFTSISHQQMWYEWVRRAYDGGLRVMVALTVHNRLLAGATVDSVKPYDDVSVMHTQIQALKEFVVRHSEFMAIALDPIDLRRIVRENKLAIIIGSETDDIGNYGLNSAIKESADLVSQEVVRNRLKELYDLGLRYIFPVHLTDNKFGGTAIYNPVFTIATKFSMGRPIDVEPAGDGITFRLRSLDLTAELPDAGQITGAMFEAIANPFAPFQLALDVGKSVSGKQFDFSDSSLGMIGVSAAAALPMIAGSPAALSVGPAFIDLLGDYAALDLPDDILPLGDNYPHYDLINFPGVMEGHRNVQGLTPLGEFAIREMMKLGMIVDLDHMGEKGVMRSLDMAEEVPGGYPMNFGHNSFRAQRYDGSENNRTPEQLTRIRALGGMMGLGWGNGDRRSADSALSEPRTNSTSYVRNDNPGSSRSFAQAALYALESMDGGQLAIGTDINGYVVGPGPRFGPQGAFGIRDDFEAQAKRSQMIKAQRNGVAYDPREGRPGASGVFNGRGVDQDKDDQDARTYKGYAYNKQQRDFFLALRIFRWGWQRTPKLTHDEVEPITEGLHDSYDRDRVKEFVRGLLLGPTNGDPGSDSDPDVNVKQKLAKAVYREKVLNENPPSEITNDETRNRRFKHFLTVWDDYNGIYGTNAPMKRCATMGVEWDYNFDGLAHYGLLPDFFQDLRNVGLNPVDMSPLFRSAEDFARMWTRCLVGADAINHPSLFIPLDLGVGHPWIHFEWYGGENDRLEEADSLEGPWRPSSAELVRQGSRMRAVLTSDRQTPQRFFRVRK